MTPGALAPLLRLVVILDAEAAPIDTLPTIAAAALDGGATMLQVRGKRLSAAALASLVRAVQARVDARTPIVVNDRLDVALATAAHGCHLGQDDLSIAAARQQAPRGFLLGGSAGTEQEARSAALADYLGVGPINHSPSKQDAGAPIGVAGFARVRAAAGLPAVAIGGITRKDVAALMRAGAAGVAVIGAVVNARDPRAAARELCEAMPP